MNSSRPIVRRLLARPPHRTRRSSYSATPAPSAMKPGAPIPGLENIYPKAKDPSKDRTPTARPRDEYPAWVSELVRPLPSLAQLRKMNVDDASDKDMKRYLKLVRKARIKQNNAERAKK